MSAISLINSGVAWFVAAAVLAFLFSFQKALSGWIAGIGGAVGSLYTAAAGFTVLTGAVGVSGALSLVSYDVQISPLNAIWLITLGLCGLFVSLYNIDWHRHAQVKCNGLQINMLMAAAVCAVIASNLGMFVVMAEVMALCAVFLTSNSKEGKPSKPYIDPYFARNYAECTRVGLPVGVYGYFKATTKAQADRELALLKLALTGKTFQLPVAVDIEDKLQVALSKSALTDIVAHCLSVVESWGVYAMLYTGLNFGQTNLYMGGTALKPYDVWLAAYRTKKPTPDWAFGMWQYTSSGKIPGIAKGADLSVAYKDYAAIIQRAGLTKVKGE